MKIVALIASLIVVIQAGALSYFLVYQITHRLKLYQHFPSPVSWKRFIWLTSAVLFLLLFAFLILPMLESILSAEETLFRL